ncbi:Protein of unknown function [Sphingomonas palmae]|uniref:Antitoxin Xre/MbcA/ParS-like toxin-binding domain-containing protein n=1 Tax=Sphingomonas palmae TaxID=1855283 RepID=A0A1H7T7D9_9SPHN|nr:MbcA/ParS/Xre antitoxin family protein [Sphingomonas palmae]SEL80812.1 Protein of unknown function [Sphingomonas palmae]
MSAEAPRPVVPLTGILARWDAVAVRWGLSGDECSALLGLGNEGPVHLVATYDPSSAERRMRLLVEFDPVLIAVLGNEVRIRAWLRRGNRNLGDRSPLEVMSQSPDWIRWLIDALGIAA